jgi:hypothetical protein
MCDVELTVEYKIENVAGISLRIGRGECRTGSAAVVSLDWRVARKAERHWTVGLRARTEHTSQVTNYSTRLFTKF